MAYERVEAGARGVVRATVVSVALALAVSSAGAAGGAFDELSALAGPGARTAVSVPRGAAVTGLTRVSGFDRETAEGDFTVSGSVPLASRTVIVDIDKRVTLRGPAGTVQYRARVTVVIPEGATTFSREETLSSRERVRLSGQSSQGANCRTRLRVEGRVADGVVSAVVRGRMSCRVEVEE
ncbi:MAG: hypothetical protein SF051_01410 [Elusimicrobiota bacterium]|nr:hypothetical protein [Elusimicrobiota bacterium]